MGLCGAKINGEKMLSLLTSRTKLLLFSTLSFAAEVQEIISAMAGHVDLQLLGSPGCEKPQM